MATYRQAKFHPQNPQTYDGNGKIHSSEIEKGIKVVSDKSGKGFRKVGDVKELKKLASIEDFSTTKNLSEIEDLKKENLKLKKLNEDTLSLVKDLKGRLDNLEGKK